MIPLGKRLWLLSEVIAMHLTNSLQRSACGSSRRRSSASSGMIFDWENTNFSSNWLSSELA